MGRRTPPTRWGNTPTRAGTQRCPPVDRWKVRRQVTGRGGGDCAEAQMQGVADENSCGDLLPRNDELWEQDPDVRPPGKGSLNAYSRVNVELGRPGPGVRDCGYDPGVPVAANPVIAHGSFSNRTSVKDNWSSGRAGRRSAARA